MTQYPSSAPRCAWQHNNGRINGAFTFCVTHGATTRLLNNSLVFGLDSGRGGFLWLILSCREHSSLRSLSAHHHLPGGSPGSPSGFFVLFLVLFPTSDHGCPSLPDKFRFTLIASGTVKSTVDVYVPMLISVKTRLAGMLFNPTPHHLLISLLWCCCFV